VHKSPRSHKTQSLITLNRHSQRLVLVPTIHLPESPWFPHLEQCGGVVVVVGIVAPRRRGVDSTVIAVRPGGQQLAAHLDAQGRNGQGQSQQTRAVEDVSLEAERQDDCQHFARGGNGPADQRIETGNDVENEALTDR
jgi:hypothetical protein